jgi:hypothetical protein
MWLLYIIYNVHYLENDLRSIDGEGASVVGAGLVPAQTVPPLRRG